MIVPVVDVENQIPNLVLLVVVGLVQALAVAPAAVMVLTVRFSLGLRLRWWWGRFISVVVAGLLLRLWRGFN